MYLPIRSIKTGVMKRLSASMVLLAVALAAGLCGPAAAQQPGGLFGDIFKPPAPVQNDAVATQQSELVLRMDRMENQLRQLTGQVEQLQYRNQQLEQQLNGRPGTQVGVPMVAPRPTGAPVTAPATGKRSDAFDPNEDPTAPGAPQPLGSPTSAAATLPPRPTGAPLDLSAAAQRAGAQPAAVNPAAGPKDMYDLGLNQVQRQDYAGAEQTLKQFLQTYPGDRLTADATYMLGESYYQRQTYKDAAEQFLQVSTKFPNSTRAPESLLRLGQSLAALNEREAACATFAEVDRKFPRATSSLRQSVEREQKRAGC